MVAEGAVVVAVVWVKGCKGQWKAWEEVVAKNARLGGGRVVERRECSEQVVDVACCDS